jgi:hypothetical protein
MTSAFRLFIVGAVRLISGSSTNVFSSFATSIGQRLHYAQSWRMDRLRIWGSSLADL